MNIPLHELPGCAKQGESPPDHSFTLLSLEQLFSSSEDKLEPLRKLGFGFSPSSSEHAVWKTKNPDGPVVMDTIAQLLHFIKTHGPCIVTADNQLILTGFFPMQNTKPANPGDYPGYTSVGRSK